MLHWASLTFVREAAGSAGPKSSSSLLLSLPESSFGLPSGRWSSGAGGIAGSAIRFFFAAASSEGSDECDAVVAEPDALAAASSSAARFRFARMCAGIWGPTKLPLMIATAI